MTGLVFSLMFVVPTCDVDVNMSPTCAVSGEIQDCSAPPAALSLENGPAGSLAVFHFGNPPAPSPIIMVLLVPSVISRIRTTASASTNIPCPVNGIPLPPPSAAGSVNPGGIRQMQS